MHAIRKPKPKLYRADLELAPNDYVDLGPGDIMDSIQSLDHVRPFNSVGEIGCGTGRLFEVFKKHYPGAVVDVFDKDVHYIDPMRSKFGD